MACEVVVMGRRGVVWPGDVVADFTVARVGGSMTQ